MVEYQSGSSDMTQSIEANVTVRPYNASPGALNMRKRRGEPGLASASQRADQRLRKYASVSQMAKQRTARMMKNGTLRYVDFDWRDSLPATTSGWAHA